MSQNPALQAELKRYLTDLLPPERVPNPNGTADKVIAMLAHSMVLATEQSIDMVLSWLPAYATLPFLELLGNARALPRYPDESAEQYRLRVCSAYEFWQKAGTPEGMKLALQHMGYADFEIVECWKTDPSHWAEFEVYAAPGANMINNGYGKAVYGQDVYGDVNVAWLARTKLWLNDVKPAHSKIRDVFVGNFAVYGYALYGQSCYTDVVVI